jgi:hypothetical protein
MATTGKSEGGLESAIDALYQGPLEAFTAERNALAAELRKAGDRAAAERVKALAKPSVTAWAVNQAWWTNRLAFDAMLEAGVRLKKAHLAWSGGGQTDVRAAAEERRRAVRTVIDAALAALGDSKAVAPDMQYRISGTVEALASGAVSDASPGRLSKDLQASGLEGLGALAAAVAAAPPRAGAATSARKPGGEQHQPNEAGRPDRSTLPDASAPSARRTPLGRPTLVHSSKAPAAQPDEPARRGESARDAAARRRAQELEKVEARQKELEARLETLTQEATARSGEESRARTAADAARAQVADLERQLDDAREHEKAARRAVTDASKAASETEMVRARTARDVAAARAQKDALRQP